MHFPVCCKKEKPFWLLDLSLGTLICSWCQTPFGLTVTNFSLILNVIVNYTHMYITCYVVMTGCPHTLFQSFPQSCWTPPPLSVTQPSLPHILFLNKSAPVHPKEIQTGWLFLARLLERTPLRWNGTSQCYSSSSSSWLEKANQEITANGFINNHTLAGVLCAIPAGTKGFKFL